MDSAIRVGLAWQTFKSANLGVSALAYSQLSLLQKAASNAGVELEILLFCYGQSDLALELKGLTLGDPVSPKRILLGRSKVFGQMRSCTLILDIGEGDSFSDIYGARRFLLLSSSKIMALLSGANLVLSPQTIGPFEKKWVRLLADGIMRRAHKVFARDGLSKAYLDRARINSEEVTDLAFALPYNRAAGMDRSKINVGVNVSGLLHAGGYTGKNQFGLKVDYPELVRKLLDSLCSRTDIQVHLVPHVVGDGATSDDDTGVCRDLHANYPTTVLAPRFGTPMEAKSYISSMDFFTGARMHACIAAFSSGVPVVPLAYSRKFNGLFQSLGYGRVADMKVLNEREVIDRILAALTERSQCTEEVQRGRAIAQGRLDRYVSYLTEQLAGASKPNFIERATAH